MCFVQDGQTLRNHLHYDEGDTQLSIAHWKNIGLRSLWPGLCLRARNSKRQQTFFWVRAWRECLKAMVPDDPGSSSGTVQNTPTTAFVSAAGLPPQADYTKVSRNWLERYTLRASRRTSEWKNMSLVLKTDGNTCSRMKSSTACLVALYIMRARPDNEIVTGPSGNHGTVAAPLALPQPTAQQFSTWIGNRQRERPIHPWYGHHIRIASKSSTWWWIQNGCPSHGLTAWFQRCWRLTEFTQGSPPGSCCWKEGNTLMPISRSDCLASKALAAQRNSHRAVPWGAAAGKRATRWCPSHGLTAWFERRWRLNGIHQEQSPGELLLERGQQVVDEIYLTAHTTPPWAGTQSNYEEPNHYVAVHCVHLCCLLFPLVYSKSGWILLYTSHKAVPRGAATEPKMDNALRRKSNWWISWKNPRACLQQPLPNPGLAPLAAAPAHLSNSWIAGFWMLAQAPRPRDNLKRVQGHGLRSSDAPFFYNQRAVVGHRRRRQAATSQCYPSNAKAAAFKHRGQKPHVSLTPPKKQSLSTLYGSSAHLPSRCQNHLRSAAASSARPGPIHHPVLLGKCASLQSSRLCPTWLCLGQDGAC